MKERSHVSRIMTLALLVLAPFSLHAQHGLFSVRDCSLPARSLVRGLHMCAKDAAGHDQPRSRYSVVLPDSQPTLGQRVFHLQVYSTDHGTVELVFGAHESFARVTSRDVNRDGSFDLVVEQSLTHRPLQVWLNDGHGNFTPANASRFRLKGREPPHHFGVSRSGKAFPCHRSLVKRGSKLMLDRAMASPNHGHSDTQYSFLFVSADEQEPRGPNPSRAPPSAFFS